MGTGLAGFVNFSDQNANHVYAECGSTWSINISPCVGQALPLCKSLDSHQYSEPRSSSSELRYRFLASVPVDLCSQRSGTHYSVGTRAQQWLCQCGHDVPSHTPRPKTEPRTLPSREKSASTSIFDPILSRLRDCSAWQCRAKWSG